MDTPRWRKLHACAHKKEQVKTSHKKTGKTPVFFMFLKEC